MNPNSAFASQKCQLRTFRTVGSIPHRVKTSKRKKIEEI